MKFTVTKPVEIDITHVLIVAPINYEEEEMPNDFPLRENNFWRALVEIETGRILHWPATGAGHEVYLTVKDTGTYTLLGPDGKEVAKIEQDYVPHGVVPGKYGDVINLTINTEGVITNWPKRPKVSAFFGGDEG
jgi:oxalate decarboxylase/phosphoglucose isomerase-like protein (cupin superfamily)